MNRFEDHDLLEKTAEVLDLPMDVVAGLPNLELLGNRQLFVTHHQGILSYSDTGIDINCGTLLVRITGTNLVLQAMTAEELRISGNLTAVALSR